MIKTRWLLSFRVCHIGLQRGQWGGLAVADHVQAHGRLRLRIPGPQPVSLQIHWEQQQKRLSSQVSLDLFRYQSPCQRCAFRNVFFSVNRAAPALRRLTFTRKEARLRKASPFPPTSPKTRRNTKSPSPRTWPPRSPGPNRPRRAPARAGSNSPAQRVQAESGPPTPLKMIKHLRWSQKRFDGFFVNFLKIQFMNRLLLWAKLWIILTNSERIRSQRKIRVPVPMQRRSMIWLQIFKKCHKEPTRPTTR